MAFLNHLQIDFEESFRNKNLRIVKLRVFDGRFRQEGLFYHDVLGFACRLFTKCEKN